MPQKTTPCGKYAYYSYGTKGSLEDNVKMEEFCRSGCKEDVCIMLVKSAQISGGLRNLKRSIELLSKYEDMTDARILYQKIEAKKAELIKIHG
jgi:hypothetical protein